MLTLQSNDPVAMAVVSAVQKGDVDGLKRLLTVPSDLVKARIVDASGTARSLLHVAADWPGHFANGAQTVTTLVAAGADVNASMSSAQPKHAETPLHWAASSNDIAVLDALPTEEPTSRPQEPSSPTDPRCRMQLCSRSGMLPEGCLSGRRSDNVLASRESGAAGSGAGVPRTARCRAGSGNYECILARVPGRPIGNGSVPAGSRSRPQLDRP